MIPKKTYQAIFISPHLDDAVFSCAGAIQKEAELGKVLIINIFTNYKNQKKVKDINLNENRLIEETNAANNLNYESINLNETDAFLRDKKYQAPTGLFGFPKLSDHNLSEKIRHELDLILINLEFRVIYFPLAVGWHVDHQITHNIDLSNIALDKVKYYEDQPYCFIKNMSIFRQIELQIFNKEDLIHSNKDLKKKISEALGSLNHMAFVKRLPVFIKIFIKIYLTIQFSKIIKSHLANLSQKKYSLEEKIFYLNNNLTQKKIETMKLYSSQFYQFFLNETDYINLHEVYMKSLNLSHDGLIERFWIIKSRD